MSGINVQNVEDLTSSKILEALQDGLLSFTPQVRKSATYVLENPNDVGVSSIREIADAADVKPNTFVRMAQDIGFEGYDDFRAPFREEIRQGGFNFPDRARWLQSLGQSGGLGALYQEMVSSAIGNIEETFRRIDLEELKQAAQLIWNARQIFTLGVGINNSNARNFTYLASTGMVQFHAIPRPGSTAVDDLAWADKQDVLIAITSKPYRSEVLEAVQIAREQGIKVISLTDSPASPIALDVDHSFIVSVETPQFFPSSVATLALLETLLSFVIASATPDIVARVEKFHERRHQLGIYQNEP